METEGLQRGREIGRMERSVWVRKLFGGSELPPYTQKSLPITHYLTLRIRHPARIIQHSEFSTQHLTFSTLHSPPVNCPFSIVDFIPGRGERIATPVCALARNDRGRTGAWWNGIGREVPEACSGSNRWLSRWFSGFNARLLDIPTAPC